MQQATVTIGIRRPLPTVAILDIQGELTAASETSLMDAYNSLPSGQVRVIVLNFNELDYMNSSGIGLLVTLLVRVNRNDQRLVAIGLNEHYRQIFEVTRLTEAIETFASESDAVTSAAP